MKLTRASHRQAMEDVVGGQFELAGKLQRDTLLQYGLVEPAYVIDVGCGSGRLAKALRDMTGVRYLGTDIVQDLLDYAAKICARPDWRFERQIDLTIPEQDSVADFVAFFSVFTHLNLKEATAYLREARRVLKNDGLILFSYLDADAPEHRDVTRPPPGLRPRIMYWIAPLINLIKRTDIEAWCADLGLEIVLTSCPACRGTAEPLTPYPHARGWTSACACCGSAPYRGRL